MKIRVFLLTICSSLIVAVCFAQSSDYQMLKAINSSGALINYLTQNDFKETSHPDSSFFFYEGKYKGDYLKVGKGWKGEVLEMGWAMVDEWGNTLPKRLHLGDLQLMPTFKENRKLYPTVFSSRKPEPGGIWDFVNFGLGESKVLYKFDGTSGSKNPKLSQIVMLRPNNRDRNLKAIDKRKYYLEKLAIANIPEGTSPWADVVKSTSLHFKSVQNLTLKKDEIVVLDLPYSLLNPTKNSSALLLVKTTKTETITGTETFANINFTVTTESGENIGDSNSLETGRNTRHWLTPAFELTNSLDEKVSFKAEISMTHDAEVSVFYFEGPNTTNLDITFGYDTKKILEKRDYVAPYVDVFNRKRNSYKERHGSINSISSKFVVASKREILYNDQFDHGIQHFLIKADGKSAPSFRLDYEAHKGEIDNRAILTIDKNNESYSYQDGYHFFEFELDIKYQGWLVMSAKNDQNEDQRIYYYIDSDDPDSTIHHIDMTPLMTTHTEDYFEIYQETTQRRVAKAMADMKSFDEKYNKKNERTKDEYLNGVENRILAGTEASSKMTKAIDALLKILDAGQNGDAQLKQMLDEYAAFKSHIQQATLYSINSKCANAYDILTDVEDDWFGYSGEAIQVDMANMENAVKTGNSKEFSRLTLDFVGSMQRIADKLKRAMSAVEGCR